MSEAPEPSAGREGWLDLIKAVAIAWIFLNHLVERVFGYPAIGNPGPGWPPLAERAGQLARMEDLGAWSWLATVVRDLGWLGDQGVQLFLVASGFGLTLGLLRRAAPARLALGDFYRRRALRIVPLWWGAHLLFLIPGIFLGTNFLPTRRAFWMSFFCLRFLPGDAYYFSPAWWFIPLLAQLYLVYPLLWSALRRWGPRAMVLGVIPAALAVRAAGILLLEDSAHLGAWSRGVLFVTRLAEFAFGIALAAWFHAAPGGTLRRASSPAALLSAAGTWVVGTGLSLFLLGVAVSPLLQAVGLTGLLMALGRVLADRGPLRGVVSYLGRSSYPLYLVHHPIILALVVRGPEANRWWLVLSTIPLTVLASELLDRVVGAAAVRLRGVRERAGYGGVALRASIGLAAMIGALLGGEVLVRRLDPPELLGWGERPSLAADPDCGWRLRPSGSFRLRWDGYDYTVTSNALGFPGPEYPPERPEGTFRILTVGDAFTSAEGVDTGLAWPRLLEKELAARAPEREVQVLNFAITGHGPNQYAAVVRKFVPRYRPDLVVIGLFVNDFEDVGFTDAEFVRSIGFHLPDPGSPLQIPKLHFLRRYLELRVTDPLAARLHGTPSGHALFLSGLRWLDRGAEGSVASGKDAVRSRLEEVAAVSREVGADVLLALIPAAVQVCGKEDLPYLAGLGGALGEIPEGPLDATLERAGYDPDLPQRAAREVADALGLRWVDLRPALRSAPEGCPYHRRNLHWTPAGHRAAASFLAGEIIELRRELRSR